MSEGMRPPPREAISPPTDSDILEEDPSRIASLEVSQATEQDGSAEIGPGSFQSILGGEGLSPFPYEKPDEMKPRSTETQSSGIEQLSEAEMTVSVDGEYIREILKNNPDLVPEDTLLGTDMEPRRQELQAVLEAIARLPERLEFKPGVTLIFGENGGGKTTLANAIRLSLNAEKLLKDGSYDSYEEALEKAMDEDERSSRDSGAVAAQGLSPYIAKGLRIRHQVTSSQAPSKMYDLSMIKGSRGGGVGNGDLTFGRSTRQDAEEGLDALKDKFRKKADVIFIDEPGMGASPRAQEKLAGKLDDVAGEKNSLIACSNSYALWMRARAGEIPYIDLSEEPEKGIQ